MEDEYFLIIEVSLYIMTALIHILGIYVLTKRSRLISRNQKLYLISLSISEITLSINHIIINTAHLISSTHTPKSIWVVIIEIMHYDGAWIINLTTMIMLTLDRFAKVLLNVRYPRYITRKRTLFIVFLIWFVSALITAIFTALYFIYSIPYFYISYRYIYPVLDTAVVLNAIVTYSYIYVKIRRSSNYIRIPSKKMHRALPHQFTIHRKRRQRFFVPVIILLTFILFVYIPDVIHFTNIHTVNNQKLFTRVSTVLYSINLVSDAAVYIFFQRGTRKLLFKKCNQQKHKINQFIVTCFKHCCCYLFYYNMYLLHYNIAIPFILPNYIPSK